MFIIRIHAKDEKFRKLRGWKFYHMWSSVWLVCVNTRMLSRTLLCNEAWHIYCVYCRKKDDNVFLGVLYYILCLVTIFFLFVLIFVEGNFITISQIVNFCSMISRKWSDMKLVETIFIHYLYIDSCDLNNEIVILWATKDLILVKHNYTYDHLAIYFIL